MNKPLLAALAAFVLLGGCAAKLSTHPVEPSPLGTPSSTSAMLASLDRPGVVTFEPVLSADWVFAHASYPADPEAAGEPEFDSKAFHNEMIHAGIYFYAIRHPARGLYIIDTGLPDDGMAPHLGFVARNVIKPERTVMTRHPLGGWLDGETPDGVFLTHLHYDHVLGLHDLPADTPVYVGAGDGDQSHLIYRFIAGSTRGALKGRPPLREWPTTPDSDGRFASVLDVFGDGSVFAIRAPGHTPGSTAYLVNAVDGPHLVTGDAIQTAAGWRGDIVEMNTIKNDFAQMRATRAALKGLADDIPGVIVHPGHQSLDGGS